MASCIWVKDQVDNAIFFRKYSYSDNDRSWNIRSQNNVYRVVASNDGSSTTVVEGTTASASDTWRFLVLNYTGSSLELWVDGVLENSSTFSGSLNNTSAGIGVGSYAGVNAGEALMTGSVSKPMIFSRSLTSGEISTLCGGGTPHCFSDIPASITDDCVYAPRLCNYNSNSGQELVDQSSSGITTTNIGSTPFNGTGLSVECST